MSRWPSYMDRFGSGGHVEVDMSNNPWAEHANAKMRRQAQRDRGENPWGCLSGCLIVILVIIMIFIMVIVIKAQSSPPSPY